MEAIEVINKRLETEKKKMESTRLRIQDLELIKKDIEKESGKESEKKSPLP